jgi:cell wall-associated NlpC family hydrolase
LLLAFAAALALATLVAVSRPAESHVVGYTDPVVAEAQTWLGVPYVYGGASRYGVDCSGLTQAVFANLGVSLPHSAAMQYGYGVPVASPGPGDLVFMDFTGAGIGHVGITAGDGTMINAPYPGTVVRYDPIIPDYVVGYKSVL